MISDPVKFQIVDAHKNFCFRPQSPKLKENIKLRPFITDKLRIEKFLHHVLASSLYKSDF